MLKIEITQKNAFFLINGKKYENCNEQEKDFFNQFIIQNKTLIKKILYNPPVDVNILK